MKFRFWVIYLLVLPHRVNGADTVTCQFTCDDEVGDVWVDGVNKKASVTPQNVWRDISTSKSITFDDSATVLAIRCKDSEYE